MLAPGTRLGPYAITAPLGAGGMGEVYRATDTNLKRSVAIKVLPASVAADRERLARFQREAEVLASLNHPNIAAIYGLERSNGVTALVMELVEGPTLTDRIAQGAIPIDEALPIAKQIAEALEAAHEQGIIHRDLKPANIKLRPDGAVKVLDFGLAKALEPMSPAGVNLTASPTITSPAMMTGVGVLLGTAAYMSPEQARGKAVDKRTDIWAFGCVLYEMLTGKRAFEGDDVSDTLATVLKSEPAWGTLPLDVPLAIRMLIQRCLEKERNRRVTDISTALFLINEPKTLAQVVGGTTAAMAGVIRQQAAWRRIVTSAAWSIVGVIVSGAGVWFATRPVPSRVSRLMIAPSSATAISINGIDRDLAISPDGSHIVYIGDNGTQLFVRALDALEPVAIYKGTARGPFVSPDGQWVGFVDGSNEIKRVGMSGGASVTLGRVEASPRGAVWAPDDTILFATSNPTTGLQRVALGGTPEVLTRPDRAQGEADHLWPEMLPGGRAVLFTITMQSGGLDEAQVAVLDLQSGTRKVLVRGGSHGHYVSSGHIVYAATGSLRAVGFDLGRLEIRGTPIPVIPQVVTTGAGAAEAVVAGNGTLVYLSGVGAGQRTLVWVNRQGQETPIPAPPRAYVYPRLAPDGMRVALTVIDQENDIWVWDSTRTTLSRLTFDGAGDYQQAWMPDGRRLIFSSERLGPRNLFWQAPDGTGAVERLTESPNTQNAVSVTPDGTRLIFTEETPKGGYDLMQVTLDGTHRVTPLVQTAFSERNGFISPDGRWLAYEGNESGRFEVHVRPYPDVNTGHWQVSTAGGTRPLWAQSGRELFYVTPSGGLVRMGVEPGQTWAATPSTPLPIEGYFTIPAGNPGRTYDLSSDGQRFLMIKGSASTGAIAPTQIVVVQHFDEELKRLVPTN